MREWDVPDEAPADLDAAGSSGVCVTLRVGGRVVGRAQSLSTDGQATARAARSAWVEAGGNLKVERDALRQEHLKDLARAIVVDVQVAGAWTPLVGETFAQACEALSPGVDGVGVRVGERAAAVFPGTALWLGQEPAAALRSAASELGLPALELGALRAQAGATVYRFRTRQAVRPPSRAGAGTGAGAAPMFLQRGDKLVMLSEVNGAGLRRAAGAAAEHLLSRMWVGQERFGLMGAYEPASGEYKPLIAGPLEQASAALALARFAGTPGVDLAQAERAKVGAKEVLLALAEVQPDEVDPLSAAPADGGPVAPMVGACAMIMAAADELQRQGVVFDADVAASRMIARAADVLESAFDEQGRAQPGVNGPERALAAFGLVAASETWCGPAERLELRRTKAHRAVRRLFVETEPARLVQHMPWLCWAELRLAEGKPAVPAAAALEQMRRTLWSFRLEPERLDDRSGDMAGGIAFVRGPVAVATWSSLRPVAAAAAMLGDARLTPDDELAAETGQLARALRFVLQLQVRDELAWAARDAERYAGAVRMAPWRLEAAIEPTSLGLLTLCEALRSLAGREGAGGAGNAGGAGGP